MASEIVLFPITVPIIHDGGKHRPFMGHSEIKGWRFHSFDCSALSGDYILDAGNILSLHAKSDGEEGIKQKRLGNYGSYALYWYNNRDVSNDTLASPY